MSENSSVELLEYCGADAYRWAEKFCETAATLGHPNIDHGWMIGWFANAIERADQIRSKARTDEIIRLRKELAEAKAEVDSLSVLLSESSRSKPFSQLRTEVDHVKAAHNAALEEAAKVQIGFQGAFHAGNPIYAEGWNNAVDHYRMAIRALITGETR